VDRCFFKAIEMEETPMSRRLKATIDQSKCYGCGLCATVCEPEAVVLKLA
jgi:Fe-S-cluster-containing hydrogenase component 2